MCGVLLRYYLHPAGPFGHVLFVARWFEFAGVLGCGVLLARVCVWCVCVGRTSVGVLWCGVVAVCAVVCVCAVVWCGVVCVVCGVAWCLCMCVCYCVCVCCCCVVWCGVWCGRRARVCVISLCVVCVVLCCGL